MKNSLEQNTTIYDIGVRDYISIALVSFTILLFQITLTRILSVVVWYHYAFLTISLVMLGLGAPGIWFSKMKNPLEYLSPSLLISGIFTPISILLIISSRTKEIPLIVIFLLPTVLSLGSAICLLLMKAKGKQITKMYAIDLLGACLGAGVVIPLMHIFPTPQITAFTGCLPLIALSLQKDKLIKYAPLLICLLIGVICLDKLFVIDTIKGNSKIVAQKPMYTKWTPTARLTFYDYSNSNIKNEFLWGQGSKYVEKNISQYYLRLDEAAGTPITKFNGDFSKLDYLLFDVTTVGYQLRSAKTVAIIGSGGGRDILTSLITGGEDIDAIELNKHTIEIISGRYKEFSGDIYNYKGVDAIASEGRSYLTHTNKKYDSIQISLIDSWAATAAGAFTLSENNLYTAEGFDLYFNRLTDNGLINISRWMFEIPKVVALAKTILKSNQISDPSSHIVVLEAGKGNNSVGSILISKQPFVQNEIDRLAKISEDRGFKLIYPWEGSDDIRTIIETKNYSDKLGYNLAIPTDNKPFFFQAISPFDISSIEKGRNNPSYKGTTQSYKSIANLQITMISVTGIAIFLFFSPFIFRYNKSNKKIKSIWSGSIYFASIGAGFMFVENSLLQRFILFLGHPSYAATVILSSLLFGMGIGSFMSEKVGVLRLQKWGILVAVVLFGMSYFLQDVFTNTLGLELALRITISFLIITPVGAIMGLFFPLGMMRFGDDNKAWYWAINGVFGVVASVFSLAFAMEFGLKEVGYFGVIFYIIAWISLKEGGCFNIVTLPTTTA